MSTIGKQRGLGRGFDALLPTGMDVALDPTARTAPSGERVGDAIAQLDVQTVTPNPHQPRLQFDEAALAQLTDSVRVHGVLQPIVVSDLGGGRFELIAGERRLRASKAAGLTTIPAIVRSFDEQQKLELALIENLQREDLNPLEVATAYRKLQDQFSFSVDDIAKRVGRDPSTISNTTRLLNLPDDAKAALVAGTITEGLARQILSLDGSAEKQAILLDMIIKNDWTVRQAEAFARNFKKTKQVGRALRKADTQNTLTRDLGEYLGTKVELQKTAKGGKLMIEYYSEEELDRIYDAIKGRVHYPKR